MSNARSFTVVSGLLALVAAGCSGGGSDSTSELSIRCLGGQSFCIISCDLGCSQTGCAVTEIAENQRLHFAFSSSVDPLSVNNGSISIRTITGVPPDGDYLVQGREVTFLPRVRSVGGTTSFGFARNESYIITLAGGPTASQGVRSIAGDTLSAEFSCTVLASRGILDEDQQPPTCELISPTNVTEAPVNPTIVLRFSELIDTTPLLAPLTASSPMRVLVRQRTPIGLCNYDSEGTPLEGVPQVSTEVVGQAGAARLVSVVTFQSPIQLPGFNCIIVSITSDLRDISGRAAVPVSFEILTVPGVSVPITMTEAFMSNAGFDPLVSGGVWQNGARPGQVGGDGRHGSFNHTRGTLNPGTGEFEFNNENFVIQSQHSLTGLQYTVTNGQYYFTDFVVPEGVKVRFTGQVPAQIYVRGQADIRGTIDVSGLEMPFWIPPPPLATAGLHVSSFDSRGSVTTYQTGQQGGTPGCGGGRGGDGANECRSLGPEIVPGFPPPYDGRPGVDVQVPAGHAYGGSTAGTGGKGGLLSPASGFTINSPLIANAYRIHFSPGGSGGGYSGPGGGSTTGIPVTGVVIGPAPAPGALFPVLPFPPAVPPPDYTALNHFVIGGSGGGGGGSHSFSTQATFGIPQVYQAGHGGTGGGGAVAIRTGGTLRVAATGSLRSKGGAGVIVNGDSPTPSPIVPDTNLGISSPGGGGSGGSFLLQSSISVTVNGPVDTGGGAGSRTGSVFLSPLNQISQAGNGSAGFYFCQAPNTLVVFTGAATPAFNPANNSGPLTDRDNAAGCTSTWRGPTPGLIFPPTWLRYELDVDEDGNGTIETTYTDSGLPGTLKANDPNGPVVILFQGSRLNQAGTEPLPGQLPRPWREGIGSGPLQGQGIDLDNATGFRFMMTYNTGLFPNLVVRALRVYART